MNVIFGLSDFDADVSEQLLAVKASFEKIIVLEPTVQEKTEKVIKARHTKLSIGLRLSTYFLLIF